MNQAEILYKIAISIGQSQDFTTAATHFAEVLLDLLQLDYLSIWTEDKQDPQKRFRRQLALTQKHHGTASHDFIKSQTFQLPDTYKVYRPKDTYFKKIIPKDDINQGYLIIFSLKGLGFIKIYKEEASTLLRKPFLDKLTPLCRQFANSLLGIEGMKQAMRNDFYRQIVETVNEGVLVNNINGHILFANKEAADNSGYFPKELVQMKVQDLDPSFADYNVWKEYIKKLKQQDHIISEGLSYRKDGSSMPLEINSQLLKMGDQELIVSFTRDITKRKKTEAILLQRQNQLRSFVEAAPAAIAMFDQYMRYIAVSKQWLKDYKLSENEDITGKNFYDIMPDAPQTWAKVFRKCLDGFIEKKAEEKITISPNTEAWIKWEARPWYNLNQEIEGFIMFTEDITAQKKQAEELRIAKEKAEDASRAKEQFLANMSHEIRTPMNAILGMARLLSRSELTEQQSMYQEAIKASADNLLVIINDILDISKIEAGKLNFESVGFNLNTLIQNVCTTNRYRAEEKGVGLFYEVDRRISKILIGDPTRMTQIFNNLVSNAIKFTDEGIVEIECRLIQTTENSNKIDFRVIDTGIGIDADKVNNIFDSFSQGDESISRKYGGTGLGLTISKRLVYMFGGELKVNSKKSIGTTFYFTLDIPIGKEDDIKPTENISQNSARLDHINILLAEDHDINQYLATTLLEEWGANVDIAENGKEAVENFLKNEYDLILMDIQMPIVGGIEATRIIRKQHQSDIPIIALTANAIKGDSERYLNAGMDGYISKPFEPAELLNQIIEVLTQKANPKMKHSEIPNKYAQSDVSESIITSLDYTQIAIEQIKHAAKTEKNAALLDLKEDKASENLYNLDKLRKMVDNDEVMIQKMVLMFLEKTPETLSEMKTYYQNEELVEVGKIAHKLKSSINLMGIDSLYQSVRIIEKHTMQNENHPDLSELLTEFIQTCQQVLTQLETQFDLKTQG